MYNFPNFATLLFLFLTGSFFCGRAIHRVDEQAQLLQVGVPFAFQEPPTGADLPNNWNISWWETFEDPELNRLIEAGLDTNLGLQQFVARIDQATALARQVGATLYPAINLNAGYDRDRDGKTGAGESRD